MSELLDVETAGERLGAAVRPVTGTETLALAEADGRVLAEPVTAGVSVPPWPCSAMDGYAVVSSDLSAGERWLPVAQRVPAGRAPEPLQPGTAARIFTGAPLPARADAVVIQERCEADADGVRLPGGVRDGDNVRRAGEDVEAGTTVLEAGMRLGPAALARLASVGVGRVRVHRRPRVAVMVTGDELVAPGAPLPPGAIYSSNDVALASLLQRAGVTPQVLDIVADTPEAVRDALGRAAAENDLIVTSGGVSVGEEDHVVGAIRDLGAVDFWKIAVKPGKPLVFGRVGETPVLGLPGNPVSQFVTFCLFARPVLRALAGLPQRAPPRFDAIAAFDHEAGGRREYLRSCLEWRDGSAYVTRFERQGSGVIESLVRADGLVEVPAERSLRRGERVAFLPFAGLLEG